MKKSLLQSLLDKKLITIEQYEKVKEISHNKMCSEEQIIMQDINVQRNELALIVQNDFGIPYIDLESTCINDGAFNLISKEVASRYS